MAIINQSNILNLQPGITAPVVVHMSEGDSGTKLSFKLIDGARAWTDPGNVVAAVHGRRQDGTQFGPYACTISGDVVSFQTDAAIAAVAGSGIAQIVLTDSDQNTAGTANFAIMVERATFPMGVTYTNDTSVYESILRYVQAIPAAVTEDYTAKINAEATAREEADATLSSNISALRTDLTEEAGARATQDAVLSARMDTFASLPSGSTSGNAELLDIRVKADGTKASTAGNAVREQITELKNDLLASNKNIHSAQNEITSIAGRRLSIENGKLVINSDPSNYWKTMIVPIDCIYIDDVATMKSGGLAGTESVSVPSMAFADADLNIVGEPVYSALSAPRTFQKSDVPDGAAYMIGCFLGHFVFAFQSNDKRINNNKTDILNINNAFEVAGKYRIETTFVGATGYYDKDKRFTSYPGIKTFTIQVTAGDVFSLTSKNYFGMARAVFFDSNGTVLSVIFTGGGSDLVEDTRIVTPNNAVRMMVQAYDATTVILYKLDIAEKLTILNDNVENTKDATTVLSGTPVELTFESATGFYNKNKTFVTYEGVTIAKVPVNEGQKYLLTTRNYYACAIACLLDAEDNIMTTFFVANNVQEVQNYEILIPNGITTLMIQRLYKFKPTSLVLVTGFSVKPIKSVLNGKRITLIGDSITESNSTALTNWAYWIKDWANPIIQNLGASGTGFIAGGSNPYSNRLSRISNPDIIGVALSFNDMSNTIADLATAAESFFDSLIEEYPTIPVICYVQSPWSAFHPNVEKSDQWVSALRTICNNRGIPFYDEMYYGSALKPWLAANRAIYYINDGDGNNGAEDWVHPNSEGHKVIARHLYPHFAENVVATGLDYSI